MYKLNLMGCVTIQDIHTGDTSQSVPTFSPTHIYMIELTYCSNMDCLNTKRGCDVS